MLLLHNGFHRCEGETGSSADRESSQSDLGGIVSLVPMRGDHRFLFDLLDNLRDLLYDLWTWSMSEVSENAWLWLWLWPRDSLRTPAITFLMTSSSGYSATPDTTALRPLADQRLGKVKGKFLDTFSYTDETPEIVATLLKMKMRMKLPLSFMSCVLNSPLSFVRNINR